MEPTGGKTEYFFNTETRQVEQGRQSTWEHLLGPFDTADEAQRAVDIAADKSDAWDEADRAWRGED